MSRAKQAGPESNFNPEWVNIFIGLVGKRPEKHGEMWGNDWGMPVIQIIDNQSFMFLLSGIFNFFGEMTTLVYRMKGLTTN